MSRHRAPAFGIWLVEFSIVADVPVEPVGLCKSASMGSTASKSRLPNVPLAAERRVG
jgi:hypothetical protein